MSEPIGLNRRRFLARIITEHYPDISNTDVYLAAQYLNLYEYRNILRLYYNHIYVECRGEIEKLIKDNAHRISTEKAQFEQEHGKHPNNFS